MLHFWPHTQFVCCKEPWRRVKGAWSSHSCDVLYTSGSDVIAGCSSERGFTFIHLCRSGVVYGTPCCGSFCSRERTRNVWVGERSRSPMIDGGATARVCYIQKTVIKWGSKTARLFFCKRSLALTRGLWRILCFSSVFHFCLGLTLSFLYLFCYVGWYLFW
jgi:hypothetical protein